jgi:hypothetical protein
MPALVSLIDQQLWMLGQDIAHPEGNALVRYGFARERTERGQIRCSRYVLAHTETVDLPRTGDVRRAIVCWGFAVYCGPFASPAFEHRSSAPDAASRCEPDAEGVLLERFARSARLVPATACAGMHHPGEVPQPRPAHDTTDRARVAGGLIAIARTFAAYEAWILAWRGADERRALAQRAPRHKRKRFVEANALHDVWHTLAERTARRAMA